MREESYIYISDLSRAREYEYECEYECEDTIITTEQRERDDDDDNEEEEEEEQRREEEDCGCAVQESEYSDEVRWIECRG